MYLKDIGSFNAILKPLPPHAFGANTRVQKRVAGERSTNPKPKPSSPQSASLVLRDVPRDVDISDLGATLKGDGVEVLFLNRIISGITSKPTPLVRLITKPEHAETLLANGYNYLFFRFPVERSNPIIAPKQCFKCQGFGHQSGACTQDAYICLRCSGPHHFQNCPKPRAEVTCANCKGDHPASSKKCPIFIAATRKATAEANKIRQNPPPPPPVVNAKKPLQPKPALPEPPHHHSSPKTPTYSDATRNRNPQPPSNNVAMVNIHTMVMYIVQVLSSSPDLGPDTANALNEAFGTFTQSLRQLQMIPTPPTSPRLQE